MTALSVLLCVGSIVYLWILGFGNIVATLGWATILLPTAWVGLYVSFRTRTYSRSILSLLLMLFGFVALNHISVLVFDKTGPTKPIWVFLLQVFVIWLPFASMVTAITKKPGKFRFKEKIDFFGMWITLLGLWSLSFFSVWWSDTLTPSGLLALTYGPTALYGGMVLVLFFRMTRGEFEYLMNAPVRAPSHAKSFSLIAKAFLGATVASLGLEFFRGMWLVAILSSASLLALSAALFLLYRNVFLPSSPEPENSLVFHFPVSYRGLLSPLIALLVWFVIWVILRAK